MFVNKVKKKTKNKSFLVIGLGRFGSSFSRHASLLGCEVVAVDEDEHKATALVDEVTEALSGNIHDEDFLRSLGVEDFDAVVVAIGYDIESSVLITTLVKDLGAKFVAAKASQELHEKILNRIGADWVIFPEKETGKKVALSLYSNIIDSMELSADFKFLELKVLNDWIGKKLSEIEFFTTKHLMLVAVKRGSEILLNKNDDFVFNEDDIVVICGHNKFLLEVIN
ncbi:MAG: TrkA family potassium uptake protein [Candidatus Pacebacteria bacterium]|nr:TrkA family potassium uptake protein [Candidatus Paceibacterota bacterium]